MLELYVLDDAGKPVVCHNVESWGKWFERMENRVVEKARVIAGRFAVSVGIVYGILSGKTWKAVP